MKKYYIDNECMVDFVDMYCKGKSYFWNLFFGWRRSHFKNETWIYSIYMIPKKVYQLAIDMAKKYDDYEIL